MAVVRAIVTIRRLYLALVHRWAALPRCALAGACAIHSVSAKTNAFYARTADSAGAVIAHNAGARAPVCAAGAGPFGQCPHSERP